MLQINILPNVKGYSLDYEICPIQSYNCTVIPTPTILIIFA